MKSSVTLKENMHFIGELDGFQIPIDADSEFGGNNLGPRPKGLMLTALAGCTAMDVISILRKMKNEPKEFSVNVETELTDEHPKVFKNILITYYFKGDNLSEANIQKAIDLSFNKYCGVSAMLKKVTNIEYKYIIEK